MQDPLFWITITPALMLLFVGVILKFFPPTRDTDSFLIKSPNWWSRDQKTWYKGYEILSKWVLIYGSVLAIILIGILLLEYTQYAFVGYLLMIGFFFVATWQTRKYMNKHIK